MRESQTGGSEAFQISWTGLHGYRNTQGDPRKLGGGEADLVDLSPKSQCWNGCGEHGRGWASSWEGVGQEGVTLGGKGTPGKIELVLGIQSWEKQGSDVDGVAGSGGRRELAGCVHLEVALSE